MTEGSTVTVDPPDEDGVGAVAIGTALWLVALIVLIIMRGTLTASGSQWWIWVAATGALLGLPGLWFTTRRRAAYRSVSSAEPIEGDSR
jgi:hypothetical protein